LAALSGGSRRLWALVASEVWRRSKRRLRAGPKYRWRFGGRAPERVLVAPPDLRHADPQIAHEIYSGSFPFSGHLVKTGGQSPFQIKVADRGWLKSLHGFRWLRHMRAAETDLATANARALVSDWISVHGSSIDGVAWEPGTTAKRIISWLQHSTVVLQGADLPFHRSFLRSLSAQIRYLRWAVHGMPEGKERLRAQVAIAFAALSLPASASTLRSATRQLCEELELQVLPDGGHVSRHPLAVMEILADLLPLKRTYMSQAETPPDALMGAIERMLPALRFFRHRDGALARFNGMGATIQDRIAAILRHDDTGGAPLTHAPHSGYERLAMGETVVIADTGLPPKPELSNAANAGCLSFEMSCGHHLFVVNCGVDTYGEPDVRPLGRATAAHSTLTLNDTSQARFNHASRLKGFLGTPLLDGPTKVSCTRADTEEAHSFVASHDGYFARFGLYHERAMELSLGGSRLIGIDRIYRTSGEAARAADRDTVAVRFHLHPDIELAVDGDYLLLTARDGVRWRFGSLDAAPVVEESIFFAGLSGPRRSRQIVLSAVAAEMPALRWRFERL
jgi:uncharacterized heparinase superfamily protein